MSCTPKVTFTNHTPTGENSFCLSEKSGIFDQNRIWTHRGGQFPADSGVRGRLRRLADDRDEGRGGERRPVSYPPPADGKMRDVSLRLKWYMPIDISKLVAISISGDE